MTKKQLVISSLSAFLIFSFSTHAAFAETTEKSTETKQKIDYRNQMKEPKSMERMPQKTGDLKVRAQSEIQKRIDKANKALAKVNESDSLSADEKAKMTAELQKELTSLQAMLTKVNSTDSEGVKQEVQNLKQKHGSYSLHGPKTSLLHSAEKMVKLSDKMASLSSKLDTKLDSLEANGQDVSSQRTLLTNLNAKLASAKTKAQNVISTVSALTPDGSEATKTALMNAKTSLQSAQEDMKIAHQDAKNILKTLPKRVTPTPSVSASE